MQAILKQAIVSEPGILREVLEEIKQESSKDEQFDRAVEDIFKRYDDVFKALA